MSTNGIIARSTGEGTFEGVYHHWDSYPNEGLGQFLIRILTGHFKKDLARMLCFLIDEHPAGWSTIVNKDFALKPGYTSESLRHPSSSGMSDEDYHAAMEQFRVEIRGFRFSKHTDNLGKYGERFLQECVWA